MKETGRKDNFKFISRILVVVLALWLGKTYIGQASMVRQLEKEKLEEEKKIIALKRDIRNIEGEIAKKDSLEFVEKVAREDYKMVKPREIIYIDREKKDSKKNFLDPVNK